MKDRELVMKVVTDELKARNIPYKIEHGRKHAKIQIHIRRDPAGDGIATL